MRERLDRLAWLGTHFRHWVPEDETVVRDVGVNEREQVSLSNTYSLNRGITQEQAAAILRTYQGIRGSLPPGSPGEWYAIYPPFAKGFGDHSEPWQYVNGGVSPIFAGELARGAFTHGFEATAPTSSRAFSTSRSRAGTQIWFAYTGAYPPVPEPRFTPVDLSKLANMDLGGTGRTRRAGLDGGRCPTTTSANLPTGRQELAGVPFLVPDPATNGRRGAVAVSRRPGFPERVSVPVGAKAGSIYVLHSVGNAGNLKVAGAITFVYEDGTEATQYAVQDRNVSGWWYPSLEGSWPGGYGSPRHPPLVKLAWRGQKRRLPERRDLLVWPRQPAPRPGDPLRRLLEHARRRHLRRGGPDAGRPAPSPEAAGRLLRRPRQLGGGGGRLRARRGPGRRRGPRRRVPRGRRRRRDGPPPGRTRRRSSSTTRPRTATWPTTTATTRRRARSR